MTELLPWEDDPHFRTTWEPYFEKYAPILPPAMARDPDFVRAQQWTINPVRDTVWTKL